LPVPATAPGDEIIDPDDTLSVLFVDEGSGLAELYRLKLELDGYWVTQVSVADAMDHIDSRLPDIIYLALDAAPAATLRLFHQLRTSLETRTIPVVILSTLGPADLRAEGIEPGELNHLVRVPTTQLSESDS
jgi:DNA-binding response OmpR family regulator